MLRTGDQVGGAEGMFEDGNVCDNDNDDSDASPMALPAISSFISSTRLNTIFALEGLLCLRTGGQDEGGAEGIFDDGGSVCGDGVGAGSLALPASSTPTTSSSTKFGKFSQLDSSPLSWRGFFFCS